MTNPRLTADGISLGWQADCGVITHLRVMDQGHMVDMLHTAPWLGEVMPEGAPPHLQRLAGDFFCAPFGDASMDGAPPHGRTANGHWTCVQTTGSTARHVLDMPVMGARVEKELCLRDGHPFVYQRHIFTGGQGCIPVANHAMLALPAGAIIRTSPKRFFETPGTALEPDPSRGRSLLRYPLRGQAHDFGGVDLLTYPLGQRHEDFVTGVEAVGHALGWTAVLRADGMLYLSLRDARALPLTMFWHSNGGRDYAPWSGRHMGVLGVEEGVGLALLGVSCAQEPDSLTAVGQPVGLALGGVADVRHVTGCLHWPSRQPLADVRVVAGVLRLTGDAGAVRVLPFDAGFLGTEWDEKRC
jgi:hypothetical protein